MTTSTAAKQEMNLMAHLLRRAGFGAPRPELERYIAQGYEQTIEELLHPEKAPDFKDQNDLIYRYEVAHETPEQKDSAQAYWVYRMINTQRPLEEKLALFYHGLFATGYGKINHPGNSLNQIEMFRRYGLGSFRTLLVELSKDGAMLHWLDNKDNHKDAVNENYGRELLELFSMGVGNYTEDDVKAVARAFTGWNIVEPPNFLIASVNGRFNWKFQFRPEEHDHNEKTFLGHKGFFEGEDIIDIIVRNPATALFIGKELYNFFVADLPSNPAWQPTGDAKAAIKILADAYMVNNYEIRPVMSTLFNSDFFKSEKSWFAKVKSPAELVVGTMRLVGGLDFPHPYRMVEVAHASAYMGQELLEPPSVEGWHEGEEWIDSGGLVERVNFASQEMGDQNNPGVRYIIERLKDQESTLSPDQLVDGCLDLIGPLSVSEKTHRELVNFIEYSAPIKFNTEDSAQDFAQKIVHLLKLIVSTREYQMA